MATVRIFDNYLRVHFILLGAVEALLFYLSVYVATYLRFGSETPTDFSSLTHAVDINLLSTVYCVVMMFSMLALGHYQSQQQHSDELLTGNVLKCSAAFIMGTFILMALFYILPSIHMGRGFIAITLLVSFTGIIMIRETFRNLVNKDFLQKNVLVFGAGKNAAALIEDNCSLSNDCSYKVVAYVPMEGEDTVVPEQRHADISHKNLLHYVLENEISEIVVALDDMRKSVPGADLLSCKMVGVKVFTPYEFLEREQGKINLEKLSPGFLIFNKGFDRSSFRHFLSRIFDVVTSLIILLLTLPILIITAILIGYESGFKHPIFYRQQRIGLDGAAFNLLKFRSMKPDAEVDGKAIWADKNDKRITAVGRFIRKVRIDELPQIFNILRGDMRLVGPRPERPEFVQQLAEQIPYYNLRHSVKPGLAGWAQLKYPYGADEKDAYEKLQYDLYYVKHQNIVMDVFILIQTIEVVLFSKGAR